MRGVLALPLVAISTTAATTRLDVTPKGIAPGHTTATAVALPRGALQMDGGDVFSEVPADHLLAAQSAISHDPATLGGLARRQRVRPHIKMVPSEVLHNAARRQRRYGVAA